MAKTKKPGNPIVNAGMFIPSEHVQAVVSASGKPLLANGSSVSFKQGALSFRGKIAGSIVNLDSNRVYTIQAANGQTYANVSESDIVFPD